MFMDFLRKYQFQIFLLTISVFLIGMFVNFGGYLFGSKGSNADSIADVNGQPIPLRIFYSHYRQALDQAAAPGKPVDKAMAQQKRDEVIRDMVQSLVFAKESDRYGIVVPDKQIVMSLAQTPAFQDKGAFSPRLYRQALESQIRMTPNDFEEEQRKSIAFFKLRWLIQSSIKVTDREFELESPYRRASMPPAEKGKKPTDQEIRQQLWQEKVLFSFNQWFAQLGRDLKVQTHFEVLDGQR